VKKKGQNKIEKVTAKSQMGALDRYVMKDNDMV
jgi:hypothetical protein